MARTKVFLVCEECLNRNYTVTRSNESHVRLELRKFCPHCGKYTLHKESK